MVRRKIGMAMVAVAAWASITPTPGTAIAYIPPIVVGPPPTLFGICPVSLAQPGGAGPGATIPFRALRLGSPVRRTTTSFTTGGSGTANRAIAAQRKAAGLPYEPPTVDPESTALPATFAVDLTASMISAPYQRMPLTASKRVAEPFGLIFAQATSPTHGRIAALTLSLEKRPVAAPRVRLTIDGPPERGCRPMAIDVYAPATSAATLARLFVPAGNGCSWARMAGCTRAQWPRGRLLFVSALSGTSYEYRWIDYDLLADWQFSRARIPGSR
jgi:hypothetical protein